VDELLVRFTLEPWFVKTVWFGLVEMIHSVWFSSILKDDGVGRFNGC
jgi:hypothetical protein